MPYLLGSEHSVNLQGSVGMALAAPGMGWGGRMASGWGRPGRRPLPSLGLEVIRG